MRNSRKKAEANAVFLATELPMPDYFYQEPHYESGETLFQCTAAGKAKPAKSSRADAAASKARRSKAGGVTLVEPKTFVVMPTSPARSGKKAGGAQAAGSKSGPFKPLAHLQNFSSRS